MYTGFTETQVFIHGSPSEIVFTDFEEVEAWRYEGTNALNALENGQDICGLYSMSEQKTYFIPYHSVEYWTWETLVTTTETPEDTFCTPQE